MARAFVGIYDKDGNQVDEIPMGQNGITGAQVDNRYQTVYRGTNEDGSTYYSATIPESIGSITLNEETGKINISVPSELLSDSSFNEIFDKDLFQQYSSAYQRNKDFKVPDPFSKEEDAKDITIPEAVEKYNQQLATFIKALNEEKKVRQDIKSANVGFGSRNNIADRLTRNDMIIMGTNAMGEGANDNSLIAIPKSMYADVNFLESFDPDSGTVKKGEFREKVFSLRKHSEDYINSMYDKLEKYFDEDEFKDTDEYARATALYSFILQNDPDMSPLQVANYVTSNFARGLGYSLDTTLTKVNDMFLGAPSEYIEQDTAEADKNYAEAMKFMSRMSSAASTAAGVGNFVGFGGALGVETAATSGLVNPGALAAAGAATTAAVGRAAGYTLDEFITAAEAGETAAFATNNFIRMAAAAEDVTVGAEALMATTRLAEAADIAADAAILLRTGNAINNVGKFAATTVVEAATTDPVVFAKVLNDSVTQYPQQKEYKFGGDMDAYSTLVETAVFDLAGWGILAAGAKGMKYFPTTKAGRYTNAVAQKYVNKVPALMGSLGERALKVRYGENWQKEWFNKSRNEAKNQARKANYGLRQAQKEVASQKIGVPFSKKTKQRVLKQEQNIINLMEVHNSVDALQRGSMAYIRKTLNNYINPVLAGYEAKLRKLASGIAKMERREGLAYRRRVFRRGDMGTARVLSKESANYLGARHKLEVLDNIEKIKGSLDEAQQAEKVALEKMLAESKSKMSKELQESLEAYLAFERKFYGEYNSIRMREGTLSSRQIKELREEGYWGENGELYRPAYRVEPEKETKVVRKDNRVVRDNDTATEKYVWGSDKDFLDPEISRYMAMSDAGQKLNTKNFVNAMSALPSSVSRMVNTADEVARVQRMKGIKKPLGERIQSVTKGVLSSGSISTGESAKRALRLQKMRAAYVSQQGKTIDAELKLSRASRNKINTKVTDRLSTIDSMTQDQLDELFSEAGIEFNFSKMGSQEEFEAFYNSLDKYTQEYVRQKMGSVAGVLYPAETASDLEAAIMRASKEDAPAPFIKDSPYITAENYNKLARMDPSFVPDLKKSLAQGQKDLRDSSMVTKATEEAKRAQLIAEREGLYKEELAHLERIGKAGKDAKDQEAILAEFDKGIDEYLDVVYSDKKVNTTLDDIVAQSGAKDVEAAKEYIVLEELLRDDSQATKELRKIARDELGGDSEAQAAQDSFELMFLNKVEERRNIARQKLADENSTLVDRKSWMQEIRDLDKEITGNLSKPGYISISNAKGDMEVWEVDPIVADLYEYGVSKPEMNMAAKFFNETSKIFRLGTTGLNLMSFVNQSFRDFGNLWLTSGSYHMINLSRAEMRDLVGPEIAEWYLREEPEIYSQLVKMAERRGKSFEDIAVERELAIGRETSTQATETALLKTVNDARVAEKISKGDLSITNSWVDKAVDKLSVANEKRERYFRNIVYADSLNQALKKGYTLKSARIQAEFMMNNATTNFSRQLVHLQALQRTVPYLGAAINGSKSFWRIFSVDPVGVMSRFIGGFVIPVMAFTGLALADPEASKKYKQLSEYEKDNNIIINVGGSLVKIPIPQEIGSLVKPWQHLVEKMHDANRHDFWELMLNDALGVSPVDITGFYDLDQDAMEDPTIWDRLDNGATQLVWGQMATPVAKAIYMAATGKDPYTGKFIDTSYQYYDSETGQVVTMDSSQSAFAKWVANTFGGSAEITASVVTALLGRTGTDVLDSLTSAVQYAQSGGEEGSLTTILERAGQSISKPLTVAEYDRTRTAWNREVSALYREKAGILNSEKYQKIEQAIQQETDPQKLKSLKAQRQDMLADWYDHTKTAISKLTDELDGSLDRYRVASLLSLLNMHENSEGIGAVGRAANEELFYEGRDEAMKALMDMGVTGSDDRSILGYITRVRQKNGSEVTAIKYYKPLEILAMQNAWYNRGSVGKAYIKELLEDGDVDYTKKLKEVKKLRQKIYDKGKLTQADRSNIAALELNWNAEVMQAIAPYVERVSPEAVINNEEVMEYLDDLILVPSADKVDSKGRTVTNKTLGEGNANDAYIKNYIRKIFEVDDSGYSTGKNYSGRETLGG